MAGQVGGVRRLQTHELRLAALEGLTDDRDMRQGRGDAGGLGRILQAHVRNRHVEYFAALGMQVYPVDQQQRGFIGAATSATPQLACSESVGLG